jgi:molybdate transport system substrate-binding protein
MSFIKRYRLGILGLTVGALVLWRMWAPDKDPQSTAPVTITVSAAADLTPAFQEIGMAFQAETGVRVIFNFGSTGQLAEQIRQGAAVDVFAAANIAFVDQLQEESLIIPETKALYAQGRITIWTRQDSPLSIGRLEDLTQPAIKRIAIANPEHAPYGLAAQEAFQAAGVWDAVSSKLLLGENVAQTLSYAQTGEVDVAIVALSLSIPSDGRWALVPGELHNPLNQALAVIKDTRHEPEARAFAAFVNSFDGRAVMRRYGFILPGEEPLASQ